MTGKSKNISFIAGFSLVASIAFANNPVTNPILKGSAGKPIVGVGGEGIVNLGLSAEKRADGMCLINKEWVNCIAVNSSDATLDDTGDDSPSEDDGFAVEEPDSQEDQDTGDQDTAGEEDTNGEDNSTGGEDAVGEDDSTGGDDSTTDGFDEEEKNQLKSHLEPLFHLSFDYGSYIVNLTPQFRDVKPKTSVGQYDTRPMASHDSLVYGDFRDGFQKTVYGSMEAGLGAQLSFWYENATGIRKDWWGSIGVLPIIGKDTQSVRYVNTLDRARSISGRWQVPKNATDLDRWDPGDSITYVSKGALVFSLGTGWGPVGIGVAKYAEGSWETYVEKVGSERAYVKMTRGKLNSFAMYTSVAIVSLNLSEFKSADDGFSFVFDLTTEVGRKAYEDMIRGNVIASEQFATQKPANFVERAPVQKVETFRSVATGKVASRSLFLPIIWDATYSRGRVNSFTTSDMHIDRNTARANYGVFTDSESSRFWTRHKEKAFMFYGAKYSVENWDTKARMSGMFGTYSYSFRHENSNAGRLRDGIMELVKKTGLTTLMVGIPDRHLGYTGLEFNVNFDDDNTMRLMAAAQKMSEDAFVAMTTKQIKEYVNVNNDPYNYCPSSGNSESGYDNGVACLNQLSWKTKVAARKMYAGLKSMYKHMNSNPKAFSAAYASFGEGMAENLFTFRTAMKLAGPGISVDYLIEGTYISMYFREWTVDGEGKWAPNFDKPKYKGLPFNPATRHSQVRGMIIGNSDAGKVPHIVPVQF